MSRPSDVICLSAIYGVKIYIHRVKRDIIVLLKVYTFILREKKSRSSHYIEAMNKITTSKTSTRSVPSVGRLRSRPAVDKAAALLNLASSSYAVKKKSTPALDAVIEAKQYMNEFSSSGLGVPCSEEDKIQLNLLMNSTPRKEIVDDWSNGDRLQKAIKYYREKHRPLTELDLVSKELRIKCQSQRARAASFANVKNIFLLEPDLNEKKFLSMCRDEERKLSQQEGTTDPLAKIDLLTDCNRLHNVFRRPGFRYNVHQKQFQIVSDSHYQAKYNNLKNKLIALVQTGPLNGLVFNEHGFTKLKQKIIDLMGKNVNYDNMSDAQKERQLDEIPVFSKYGYSVPLIASMPINDNADNFLCIDAMCGTWPVLDDCKRVMANSLNATASLTGLITGNSDPANIHQVHAILMDVMMSNKLLHVGKAKYKQPTEKIKKLILGFLKTCLLKSFGAGLTNQNCWHC